MDTRVKLYPEGVASMWARGSLLPGAAVVLRPLSLSAASTGRLA